MNARWRLLAAGCAAFVLGAAAATPADSSSALRNLAFRNIGPATVGGRISAVLGVPGNPDTLYVGTAGGGVWKSVNGGDRWTPIFEHERTSSIGALTLVPGTTDRLWVGTGESNVRNDVIDGAGVFFSPDGGKTWQDKGLAQTGQISSIVVDAADPSTVFVAALGNIWRPTADRGVYRTTDAGKTWKKVLYVADDTGAIDLKQVPGHPNVLLAAMWQARRWPWIFESGGTKSGIYRSMDGGKTWKRLVHGLPDAPIGRIGLAVAPSNPNHVYALIGSRQGVLWESRDLGDTWQMVSDDHRLNVRPFYFSKLTVAPDDDNRVYVSALNLRESDDGGKTSRVIDQGVHVDKQALWIDPKNPRFLIQGNDGGVFTSRDRGATWRFLDNLPIGQFYSVAADDAVPFNLCGGLQDNGGWCGPSSDYASGKLTGAPWQRIVAGDGHYVVPAGGDSPIVYADTQRGNIVRHDRQTGLATYVRPAIRQVLEAQLADLRYRFNWTAPIAVAPGAPNTVYLGANVLFKSTDGGDHWQTISGDLTRNDKSKQVISGGPVYKDNSGAENYDTILSIGLAERDPGVIWIGTDDGLVHVTRDGGAHWSDVTPPRTPRWARISQIGVSPFDPGTAYVAVDAHMLGDRTAYAYRTRDYGKTWTVITRGIALDVPVHVVREDPGRQGLLVMGTDTGLYYSRDAGEQWSPMPASFPTVPVLDLRFVPNAGALAVATHGRGLFVLDNLRPLEYLSGAGTELALAPAKPGILFDRPVVRMNFDGAAYAVPNAPSGVTLAYVLPAQSVQALQGKPAARPVPVKITVTGADGRPVATRSASATPGVLNQYVWNLRHDGPTPLKRLQGNTGGPLALPGTYRVTVAAAGESATQDAQVLPDPLVAIPDAVACRRLDDALAMRNRISAANELLNRVADLRAALAAGLSQPASADVQRPADAGLRARAAALDRKLAAIEDSLYNPDERHDVPEDRLHGLLDLRAQLISAYGYTAREVGATTAVAIQDEARRLEGELNRRLAAFQRLLETDVKVYRAAADSAGPGSLPNVRAVRVTPVQSTCTALR